MPPEGGSPEKSDQLREELLEEVQDLIYSCLRKIDRNSLLLAVSGGVDSMVMLDLLHRSGHAAEVVHFDHGLRDSKESEADRILVRRESEKRGLPFHFERLEPPKTSPSRGIQHWAREERYRVLYRIQRERGHSAIATAHQADDRLETVLMGMLRGSGFRGVVGIPREKDGIIRPLARIWKERIREYARLEELPYREDPSNRSDRYLRNRIRKELMPSFLSTFYEKRGALLRSLELLEGSGAFLQEMGERERTRLLRYNDKDGSYRFSKAALKASSAPRILFFEILHPFGIQPAQADELLEGIDGLPGARVEGNGWTLLRDREDLILYPVEKKEKGSWTIPSAEDPGDSPLSLSVEKGKEIEGTAYEACMDPDKLQFPLELRSIREKDRFRPLGMRRGSKTVREHLTDRKWPLHEKERALVLADAEGRILWVVGSTIDDRCKVGEGSKKLLRVHYTGS